MTGLFPVNVPQYPTFLYNDTGIRIRISRQKMSGSLSLKIDNRKPDKLMILILF